jgi:hypothetical protein
MKEANEEEFRLRRYLLGELGGGEQESIEERFMTDRDFKERVLVIEDELVEDYLSGELSEAEEASFVRHCLSTPEQRRRVRLAGAVRTYMAAEVPAHPTGPGGDVRTPGVRDSEFGHKPFWRNPSVLVPASLALLLAVALGVGWLVVKGRRQKELADSRLELERLNRQPVSDGPRWIILSPLNVRGDREANVLQRPAGGTVVQLWLMLVKDEYQIYQVILRKDGDVEQFPVGGLRAETTPHGRAIPLRIPAAILTPGTFILKLNGVGEGNRVEEIGEYNFRVTR